MVSDETLPNYMDWDTKFTVYTDEFDKKLGAVIIKDNKPIDFS